MDLIYVLCFIFYLIRNCHGQLPEVILNQCRGESCSIFSHDRRNKSIINNITCQIENKSCFNIPERQHTLASISPPLLKKKRRNWYLFKEGIKQKIALNFSWSPNKDSSVEGLRGYRINVLKKGAIPDLGFERSLYYCLYTNISFFSFDFNAEFFYDCFGKKEKNQIFPGDLFRVTVYSIPYPPTGYDRFTIPTSSMEIIIPRCSDEDQLFNVSSCVAKRRFVIELNHIDCTSRTASFFYNVPEQYGDSAIIFFAESSGSSILRLREQNLTSDNFIFYLNKSFFFNTTYNILVWGNETGNSKRQTLKFNFTECIPQKILLHKEKSDFTTTKLTILLVCLIILVIIMGLFMYGLFKFEWNLKKLIKKICCCFNSEKNNKNYINALSNTNTNTKFPNVSKSVKDDGPMKVYIVHVADNEKHKGVVLRFATFLQHDLGFDVIIDLWNDLEVSKDITLWMQGSIDQAQKIIVIWSPEANLRWQDNSETLKRDMFSPVVRHIKKDLFLNKNCDKYFFTYFPYCNELDIPVEFRSDYNIANRTFLLMEQFERLYFLLSDIEKFGPGEDKIQKKARFDSYYDPAINIYGLTLKQAIEDIDHEEEVKDIKASIAPTSKESLSTPIEMISIDFVPPQMLANKEKIEQKQTTAESNKQPIVIPHKEKPLQQQLRQPQESDDFIPSLEPAIEFSCTPEPSFENPPRQVYNAQQHRNASIKQPTEHTDGPTSSEFFSEADLNPNYQREPHNEEFWKSQHLPIGYKSSYNKFPSYGDKRPSYENMNTLVSNSIEDNSLQYQYTPPPPPQQINLPYKPPVALVPIDMVSDPLKSLSYLNDARET